jgi:hypothetical protein
MLKHALQFRRVLGHVDVLEGGLALAVLLTGGRGIGSRILAEDQNGLCHLPTLLVDVRRRVLGHTSTTTCASQPPSRGCTWSR